MFSSATSSFRPLKGSASVRLYALNAVVMGRVRKSMPRLRAERLDGNGGHERGVDAAGQSDDHPLESVLADVVAGAENEGLEHFVHRRQRRHVTILERLQLARGERGQRHASRRRLTS